VHFAQSTIVQEVWREGRRRGEEGNEERFSWDLPRQLSQFRGAALGETRDRHAILTPHMRIPAQSVALDLKNLKEGRTRQLGAICA
jgi:hypothetical protein